MGVCTTNLPFDFAQGRLSLVYRESCGDARPTGTRYASRTTLHALLFPLDGGGGFAGWKLVSVHESPLFSCPVVAPASIWYNTRAHERPGFIPATAPGKSRFLSLIRRRLHAREQDRPIRTARSPGMQRGRSPKRYRVKSDDHGHSRPVPTMRGPIPDRGRRIAIPRVTGVTLGLSERSPSDTLEASDRYDHVRTPSRADESDNRQEFPGNGHNRMAGEDHRSDQHPIWLGYIGARGASMRSR